jgi:membrane protein YdbS with pleckstrin-like domain
MSAFAIDEHWRRPSPRLLLLRRVQVASATIAVGALAGGLFAATAGWIGAAVAGAVVLAGGVAERFVRRRVHAWAYLEREDDLLVRRGVMFARLSVVPYGRMQFIDVTAGPFERSFGLATVRMHTAAAASDARIPGLAGEEAARLRDQLAELGEAQAAGL